MKCFACGGQVIHGGDHSFEDHGMEGDGMVSNLHCVDCGRFFLMYSPEDDDEQNATQQR